MMMMMMMIIIIITLLGVDSFIFLELLLFKSRHIAVLHLELNDNVIYKLV